MEIDVNTIKKLCDPSKNQRIYVDDLIIEEGAIQKLPQVIKEKYPQCILS